MAKAAEYPLATGYRSSSRLNLQHYLWKQDQGYILHPSISSAQEPGLKIADIGTGTGIWLLDLSTSVASSAQLDGFDIDLSQCPPEPWLPTNVSIRKLNIFDGIPDHLIGQYDIVHIRFFLCVVTQNDPTPIIRQAMKMLRPNGWIQWSEQDLKTLHVTAACEKAETKHTEALKEFALAPTPQWPTNHGSWVASLSATLEALGFEDVVESRNKKHPWYLPNFEDVTMLAMEEMASKLPHAAEVLDLIQKAAQEFESNGRGVVITSDRVTVVGRKPSVAS